jgi:23S rRNA (adenine2030-N6)-methyltransferase
MNYRHAYHAGNFADVVKHAVVALILRRLLAKPQPMMVLDAFAGVGLYDLGGVEALKTGEAARGIQRVWPPPGGALGQGLAPYLDVVAALNPRGPLALYPGSPELARRLLRLEDRLVLVELHPDDCGLLRRNLGRDPRVQIHQRDGFEALPALLPPAERRGLVLIDPPYEQPDEATRLAKALGRAYRRWPTGVYAVWYPIKERAPADALLAALRGVIPRRLLVAELTVFARDQAFRLNGCGLALVNPPWQLDQALGDLLPRLQPLLAQDGGGTRVEWLVGEGTPDNEP